MVAGLDWNGSVIGVGDGKAKVVDRIVRVQCAVTEEFERAAMERVGSGLGDGVDDRPTGTSVFGGVAVRVHLEFRNGIFGELIRRASRTGTAQSLSEEGVVVVGPVDGQRV